MLPAVLARITEAVRPHHCVMQPTSREAMAPESWSALLARGTWKTIETPMQMLRRRLENAAGNAGCAGNMEVVQPQSCMVESAGRDKTAWL